MFASTAHHHSSFTTYILEYNNNYMNWVDEVKIN